MGKRFYVRKDNSFSCPWLVIDRINGDWVATNLTEADANKECVLRNESEDLYGHLVTKQEGK